MKLLLAAAIVAVGVGLAQPTAVRAAQPAAPGPDARCYGQIIAGIARTWPWAHDAKVAFQPPPGAIALWIQEFGPSAGVTSVRQLQVMFCSST
jgi:hypothetical protein